MAGGSWALESDRIDEVFVQFIDEEAKAASDQLMAAVYSDAVASGLGKAYEGCRQAEEIHHGIQSSDTATLSIQERTSYTNMQFFGLRREGDILYFLEGDEAVVWGFSLKEDTYKLPDEIIPEELGGCPVTRVDLTARSTDLMYGREDIVQGTYIAIPATAEVVGIRQSMSVTYLIPEHVKTLYVPAIAILQNSGTTILAAGRDMRVVINNRKGILASGPSIQAYYGTDLARLAENMRWNLTYLDTFDGRWEDTEKMVSERLDQYEAEDPEAYNDLVEGIGRDGLMDQVKENWEDIVLDASDPGKESLVAYQHFKVGDYTPIMDQDALTAEAEAYEGELGPELPASDTRGEEEPANEEQENEEWSGAVESHSTAEPHFTEEPLVTEEPQVPDEPYTPEEPQVTDEPYTAEEPSAAGNTVVASGGCGDAGSSLAWSLSGDGVLTISGSGRMKDYSHPQYAPQSSFAEWQKWDSAPWLYYDICTGADGQPLCRIQQVEFGEGITYIGEYAFTYSHIPSVTLPEGLTEVGVGAFGSSELTSVTLPSTLRTIGSNAFTGCKIASLTIPEGVTAVGGNAFGNSGCSATTGARNMIIFRQIMDVTILSRDCAIEDTGKENNAEDYAGWDDIYTVGDPSYTIISGYPGSTAEAFAQKWGYTFRSLDDASEQTGTGKKLLAVETYNDKGELSGKKSYEYNDAGLPVRCVEQSYGDWSTKLVYTYTYDGEGRLLNKHMSRDDGEYETDVFVRSYNDDGTLALSSYTGIQDIWTTEEYTYDENGLVVREKQTIFVGEDASGYYSFENSVDEQGNLTAIRRYEDSSEPRDAVFIYGPDGRMLQGYDEYWLTPITYTYVDDPCFCVRDETGSMGDGYGGMTSYTRRVAYILDSAGREVESYVLGTVGEMELTYSEDGYISSVASYYNGYRGVETRFIYGDPADAAAAAAAAPVESVRLTVTGNEVNIRTGPGTEYESRGRVNSGTILVSTGKSGDWYQVEYNGGTGYIIQDYVQQAAAPAPAQPAGGTLAVNGEDVNVRSGPGTGYEALGQVSRGVTLTVTGKSDNWYQVEYKGGTGYIIEDYVILNTPEPAADSAQDTAAMDEAALAATLEGDWSGFIGALAEQYGVMSTEEISMSESWSSPTVWTGGDITGLLSATVLDLDLDGQQELFTVRMDYSSDDWYGDGSYKDHTHLYLTVYEPGSGEPAAERVFFPGAEIVGDNLGAMCQFTVFTYDYAGVRYICLDDYATMNETQTIVNFFSYDGSQLVFEGAGDYEEYGEGDVYVYRADTEPDDFRGFTRHLYNNDNHWQTVMSFSVADADWHGLEPGEEQAYFEAYTDILAEYGLIADHDERIWINQTDEDRYKYCTLTAPDVYTAAEGELRPLAQAGRFYEYDSEGNMLFVLHRTDCEGTLDSFRSPVGEEENVDVTEQAAVDENGSLDGLLYRIDDDAAFIYGYEGTAETLQIPAEIQGLPVKFDDSVSGPYFSDCATLREVILPETITRIPSRAFTGCTALESVQIPDSVTALGNAFGGCSSLREITIPASVESIAEGTFCTCPALTAINVEEGNQYYTSIDGVLIDTKNGILVKYPEGKEGDSYTIPESVRYIGENAFAYLRKLKEVIVPETVEDIQTYAFSHNSVLERVQIDAPLKKVQDRTFFCSDGLKEVILPDSVEDIGGEVFRECTGLTSIRLPESLKVIRINDFLGCTSLEEVTVPASVKRIEDQAFFRCYSLTKLTILNPECEIYDDYTVVTNSDEAINKYSTFGTYTGVICGYEGSTAEDFAKLMKYQFQPLAS